MAVTAYQEKRIRALRQRGVGYRTIAAELGISREAVRNFCTAHDLSGVDVAAASAPTHAAGNGGLPTRRQSGSARRPSVI